MSLAATLEIDGEERAVLWHLAQRGFMLPDPDVAIELEELVDLGFAERTVLTKAGGYWVNRWGLAALGIPIQ
jgi:hypothetical protein